MSRIHNQRILEFIEAEWIQHGHSPTYREIGVAVGISSSDHVARDLRRMAREGYISFVPHLPRSIVVLKKGIPKPVIRPSAASATQLAPHARGKKLERTDGHCRGCGILEGVVRGESYCEACKNKEPYCQEHTLMGGDRYYQTHAQRFVGFESQAAQHRRRDTTRRRTKRGNPTCRK